MIEVDAYCREIEAYLCRKNDGHLIRISGPAFERVMRWAQQGIPLTVAQAGIDRYFERYYRRGPRRRPVRVDFCEPDVLDAFDAWRRAVGVGAAADSASGETPAEAPVAGRAKRSLAAHIESVMNRLTLLRGSDQAGPVLGEALEQAVRGLDPLAADAPRARGAARDAVLQQLADIDHRLLAAAIDALPAPVRTGLEAEATRDLESFRSRMTPAAYGQATHAALGRLARLHFGLPDLEPA